MSRKSIFGLTVEPSGVFYLPLYFFSFIGALLISSSFGFNQSTFTGFVILSIVFYFLIGAHRSERVKNSYFGGRFVVVVLPLFFILVGFELGIYKWLH